MDIFTPHGLLINRTMNFAISTSEPTQTIPLVNSFQAILHLPIREMLGTNEVIEHVASVDECKHSRDSRWISRQEWVTSSSVHERGCTDSENDNRHGESDGGKERQLRLILVGVFRAELVLKQEDLAG